MGRERGDTEQWKFPGVKLSEEEKTEIVATVVSIATETLFKNHLYSFGGKFYRQSSGGPIGLRGTCAIARLVMCIWDTKWLKRMRDLGLLIWLAFRYMDDGRVFMPPIKPGWRWCGDDIKYCKAWEMEDSAISPTVRTMRVLEGTMKGVEGCLRFTMECGEDFESGWLATLDTDLGVSEQNVVNYKFYEC